MNQLVFVSTVETGKVCEHLADITYSLSVALFVSVLPRITLIVHKGRETARKTLLINRLTCWVNTFQMITKIQATVPWEGVNCHKGVTPLKSAILESVFFQAL